MRRREKRTLQLWLILILTAAALGLTISILLQSIWATLVILAVTAFYLYWFNTRYHKRVKPHYPMTPSDALPPDTYFPRTNIPRPIHADAIKLHQKQKQLQQINKLRKKKK